jgi:hypothetical protein
VGFVLNRAIREIFALIRESRSRPVFGIWLADESDHPDRSQTLPRRRTGTPPPVKTDRNDARGIAQLMRLGWFRPVHCKSLPAQEVRALLTARKPLQTKNHDVEMSLRGVLRGFGLKVGRTTPRTFASHIRELVAGHATLSTVAEALLAARSTLFEQ